MSKLQRQPGYLFTVAQIFNLPYRRFVIGRASERCHAPWFAGVWESATLRYSTARRSRNQRGPRLWSKTQPQRVAPGNNGVLRLVLRTQPRSAKFARLATILGDTNRLQVCATGLGNTVNTYHIPKLGAVGAALVFVIWDFFGAWTLVGASTFDDTPV